MLNNEPGMGKNYWLAMILSMAVLLSYPIILKKLGVQHSLQPIPAQVNPEVNPAETAGQSLPQSESVLSKAEGPFLEPAPAPASVQYKNLFYDLEFSTRGGTVTRMDYLGETQTSGIASIPFFESQNGHYGIFGIRFLNEEADLSQSIFQLNRKGEEGDIFEFLFEKNGEYRITKTYRFKTDNPVILLDITVENISPRERNFPIEFDYGLHFEIDDPKKERSLEVVAQADKLISANHRSVARKGFLFSGPIEWTGIVKRYFALLVKPNWPVVSTEATSASEQFFAAIKTEPFSLQPGQSISKQIFIYAGPQRYEVLNRLNMGFEHVLSRGFFGIFKIWLLHALKFLDRFTHNFGLAIILLTLALKGVFSPLTHMSFDNMKKMQALQPKLKSIQERYKKEPEKLQREMMELYKRNKVNPMGGCLPMVLQIPIFIAFYQMLNEAIELKGASFWWIKDLAEPDRLISFPFSLPLIGDSFNLLPVLMLGSMVWQQHLTPQPAASPEQAKMMTFMPVIFGFLFYNVPSGLVLYWFLNNLFTIIHQTIIKRMVVVLHHEDAH